MSKLEIGGALNSVWFLIKDRKEFPWGIIGTVTNQVLGDVSFKFSNAELKGDVTKSVARVTGTIEEYNGQPQVRGVCIFQDEVPEKVLANLTPTTPINTENAWADMYSRVSMFTDQELGRLVHGVMDAFKEKFVKLPGGKTMHHAVIGGLIEHSYSIFLMAFDVAARYPYLNKDVLSAGAILHDIGKVYEFDINDAGMVSQYSMLGNSLGHAAIGVGIVMAKAHELGIDITKPHIAALLNIIGTHAGDRDWGAVAENTCAEAFVISALDNMDARIYAVRKAVSDVQAAAGEPVMCKAVHGTVYAV